jgi:hypothetical protein
MMRRRPLMRAAVVGGGAYVAGRHMANKSAEAQPAENQESQPPGPAPQAAPPLLDQLNQLEALHQQGALTDSEFSAAKAKLLA